MPYASENHSSEISEVIISINPIAGPRNGRAKAEQLVTLLRRRGYQAEIETDLDRLNNLCSEKSQQGTLRAVVAAGGDGTVATVANLIPEQTPLTVLPLGTENLLAKYFGMTSNPEAICETICAGEMMSIDVGRANSRLFLLMVGCGFDAEVIRRLHSNRRGHIHHISYMKPILETIRNYQYPELRVYCDDCSNVAAESSNTPMKIHSRWAFVANLPQYAFGARMAPQAVGTDGLFDVCTFREGSLWHTLRYLSGIYLEKHQSWQDYNMIRTTRVRIEADEQVPFQLDGDPGGFLPVEIELLPKYLQLIVPQECARLHSTQLSQGMDQ